MKIIIALDGSPIGESAVAAMAPWAKAPGAEVHLLTIVHPDEVHETAAGTFWQSLGGAGTPSGQPFAATTEPAARMVEDRSQAFSRAQANGEKMLHELAQRYLPGIPVTVTVAMDDDTASAIVRAAARMEADVVAMGTRGRGGIGRTLLGSVAETVVRESHVPVLLVGPQMRSDLTSHTWEAAADATPPVETPPPGADAVSRSESEKRISRVRDADTASLVDWIGGPDWQLRRIARDELVLRGEGAVDALVAATRSRGADTRWGAAKALREIHDSRSAPALIDMLEDTNSTVRWSAAEALIAIGKPAVAPVLRRLIVNPGSVWLHEGAHHVLQRLVEPEFSPVVNALEGPYPSITVPPRANEALEALDRGS